MELLGKSLFEDTNLSEPAGQACASCHDAAHLFTDPDQDKPTSEGVHPALFGKRNTPTALYMRYSPPFHYDDGDETYVGGQFLDGRAATLEDQAKQPFLNPIEMANLNKQAVVDKVRTASYAALFKQVFGPASLDDADRPTTSSSRPSPPSSAQRLSPPLAPSSIISAEARPTDYPGDCAAWRSYTGANKGNCAACHPITPLADGTPPLFTDFTYDNLGVPRNPDNLFYTLGIGFNPDGWDFVDLGLGGALGIAEENGKFKVPTLRNIAMTAPVHA